MSDTGGTFRDAPGRTASFFRLGIVLAAAGCGGGDPGGPSLTEQAAAAVGADAALRSAASEGRLDGVARALERGARVDGADEDGRTALMLAAFEGRTSLVKLLLERGADPDAADGAGRTALLFAASGPNGETVRLLLDKGARIDHRNAVEGYTALMYAAAEGQAEVVRILLERGADAAILNADGDRALEFAVKNGHEEAARLLRKK